MKALNDLVLDTNILSDVIAVYYENDVNRGGYFSKKYRLSKGIIDILNEIIYDYREVGFSNYGVVSASSFAFIEIGRKYNEICAGRFTIEQFKAFTDSPPLWFVVESVDESLFLFLNEFPMSVRVGDDFERVEWADAIHVATTLSRGRDSFFATTDKRLINIPILTKRLIY